MAVGHGEGEVSEGCGKLVVKQTEEKDRVSLTFISDVRFAYVIADWSRIQHRLGRSVISHGCYPHFSSLILKITSELHGGDVLSVTYHVIVKG